MPFDPRAFMAAATREMDVRTRVIRDAQRDAALAALTHLASDSPVWTGWYLENHRIVVGDGDVERTEEPDLDERLAGTGARAISAGELRAREADEADQLRFGGTIRIANAVPYAEEIEISGTKTRPAGLFYHRARDVAEVALMEVTR
jgi:hypothetical protein